LAFYTTTSFEVIATHLGLLTKRTISKQAVAKRISKTCIEFLINTLHATIFSVSKSTDTVKAGVFKTFKRVLIQDSTCIQLPAQLAHYFPGSKNQTGKTNSILKIQTIYDLLKETFVQFTISGFTYNDQRASQDILELLRPNDLVIRDLGYFASSVFQKIDGLKAFFLSRLLYGTSIFAEDKKRKLNILTLLRQHGNLDINVCIGEKEKVPLRLVAIQLPQSIATERRRKARNNRDHRNKPSKERLALLGWEIFVTNVSDVTWNSKSVAKIYGLRWRIEIIFKSWKSHFKLSGFTTGSRFQIEALIYSRLIFITIFQTCLFAYPQFQLNQRQPPSLSLLKVARFFSQHPQLIYSHIAMVIDSSILKKMLVYYCSYDKRQDRRNYSQILHSLS